MGVTDKTNSLGRIMSGKPVALELGCGERKRNRGSIGIDKIDYPGVDLVGDVRDVLQLIPKDSVDMVSSYHFIEHIDDLDGLMIELSRIVKAGGKLELVAPHFSNPFFYSDPTHRSFYGLYTLCYHAKCNLFSRSVPTYKSNISFSLQGVELIFKSNRPFYLRHAVKKLFGSIVNMSRYTQEFYEENLCYLFPCYEVSYGLVKIGTPSHADGHSSSEADNSASSE